MVLNLVRVPPIKPPSLLYDLPSEILNLVSTGVSIPEKLRFMKSSKSIANIFNYKFELKRLRADYTAIKDKLISIPVKIAEQILDKTNATLYHNLIRLKEIYYKYMPGVNKTDVIIFDDRLIKTILVHTIIFQYEQSEKEYMRVISDQEFLNLILIIRITKIADNTFDNSSSLVVDINSQY